jgi:hypothetical protein
MNHDSLLAGRESSCRDNTMEGNVGFVASRFPRLSWADNGEAGAFGQPPQRAFPKAFLEAFLEAFAGLKRSRSAPALARPKPQLYSSALIRLSNFSHGAVAEFLRKRLARMKSLSFSAAT